MKPLILALLMAFTIHAKATEKVIDIEYVCNSQIEVVKVTVQDKVKLEGWQPLGPMTFVCNRYQNEFMYCQTLVKYKKP